MSATDSLNPGTVQIDERLVPAEAEAALSLLMAHPMQAKPANPAPTPWDDESLIQRATATTQVLSEMLSRHHQHRHWGLNE